MGLLRNLLSVADPYVLRNVVRSARAYATAPTATCNLCGYTGRFDSFGDTNRFGAMCPKCRSLERARLFGLAIDAGFLSFTGKDVLHFAPERSIRELVQPRAKSYVTADITPDIADLVLNIEDIALESATKDIIVCSHVLEHVDDRKALREMHRVLRPGGQLIAQVPIVESWHTFEDGSVVTPEGRRKYFAQDDHVRYYGRDFRERVTDAGFDLAEFSATGKQAGDHSLLRGEIWFRAETIPAVGTSTRSHSSQHPLNA